MDNENDTDRAHLIKFSIGHNTIRMYLHYFVMIKGFE